MSKFITKFPPAILVLIFFGIPTTHSMEMPSYSLVVQSMEQLLSNLEETANDLKTFETTQNGLVKLVEMELPKLVNLVKEYHKELLSDEYLVYTLQHFPRFSDPLRILWTQINETGVLSYKFLQKVSTKVRVLTRSYEDKWAKETDASTSPLVDEYTKGMKSLLSNLIQHQFTLSNIDSGTGKQSLKSLQKLCQSLAVEVGNHETSKQVLERVKRTANSNYPENGPCTKAHVDTDDVVTTRSKILRQWTEEVDLKIPETLTYAILSCYQLQAADAILQYMSSLYPADTAGEIALQELQQRETDLALTAVWIREKFSNQTIHHRKVDGGASGSSQIIQNENGEAVPAKEIWMCDPEIFEVGTNFIRFSGLFQTCIYEEYALSPHESCSGKCKHYKGPHEYDQASINQFDKKQLGHLPQNQVHCVRMEGEVQICPSSKNDERYEWFSVGSRHFGKPIKNETCKLELEVLKEEWRLENAILSRIPQLCEICQCQCNYAERGRKQVTYFSIAEVLSVMEQNMIVTGIRFETKYGIIYTSIETGKLLASGTIDQSSLQWISPSLMSKEKTFEKDSTLRLGSDFDTIYLDDIVPAFFTASIERRHVLTGIRYRRHMDHVSLEAQFTLIDPTTKSLSLHESVWLNRLDDHRKREKLNFRSADDPVQRLSQSTPNAQFNQAIQFTSASIEKTAGQVVVPYFDSQPVHFHKRSAIHGLGIFLKGNEGFAGFLAFRLSVS